ncbi:MAG: CAP domain-containing protein [Kovacikia sp.]
MGFYRLKIAAGVTTNRTFLSCTADGTKVDLYNIDDSSGRQQWLFEGIGNGKYRIKVAGGVSNSRQYLSCTSDGAKVDLYNTDDGSGRQQWILEDLGNGKYRIKVAGGVSNSRQYLSCTADGTKVDLYHTDDGSGRQQWITQSTSVEQNAMADEILKAHNRYRAEVGVPALTWSNTLASHAQEWANHLASLGGVLQHSSGSGEGENLWGGTSGQYSYTQMIESFGNEKRYFVRGTFPNVSSTGNWADVGHYTQMVWRNTTQVGCAIARANGKDVLVCRYSPPGNYGGQIVF